MSREDNNTRMFFLIEVLWLQAISLDKIKDRRNQVKKAVSKETNDKDMFYSANCLQI